MDSNALITHLQKGIPLVSHPFAELGDLYGGTEDEVLNLLHSLFTEHKARRLGGVFDAYSLGYLSTLAAVQLDAGVFENVVEALNAHEGISHNYLREGMPNVWFTLTAHQSVFEKEKEKIQIICSPSTVHWLPATARYKIEVFFDLAIGEVGSKPKIEPTVLDLDSNDKILIALLQKPFPLVAKPFEIIASHLGIPELNLLEKLQDWERRGGLRRIGLILRHAQSGIHANAMALWRIDPKDADVIGQKIAAYPYVSHCYLRDVPEFIAGNLYAMTHAKTEEELASRIECMTNEVGLPKPLILRTLRELKKRSAKYF